MRITATLVVTVEVRKSKAAPQGKFRAVKEVSVMAWIENQFGDVLLLKQKRGNQLWTLPGGKVRMRESLVDALKREVSEETGLKIQGISLSHVFDRPDKSVITFLYTARIRGRSDIVYPKLNEIETAKFTSSMPKTPTPSLKFFWKKVHASSQGGVRCGERERMP
jgi:ADP-ribose pyrophosphatase YjhB (NUDIX family)